MKPPDLSPSQDDLAQGDVPQPGEDRLFWDWRKGARPLTEEEMQQRAAKFVEEGRAQARAEGVTSGEFWVPPDPQELTTLPDASSALGAQSHVITAEFSTLKTPVPMTARRSERLAPRWRYPALALVLIALAGAVAVFVIARRHTASVERAPTVVVLTSHEPFDPPFAGPAVTPTAPNDGDSLGVAPPSTPKDTRSANIIDPAVAQHLVKRTPDLRTPVTRRPTPEALPAPPAPSAPEALGSTRQF